jgi:rhodanese-related sulfurtransferase
MAKQSEWDISVEDLKGLKDGGADFVLLDVREEREFAIGHIDGQLLPLGTLPDELEKFEKSAHIVVQCRSGGRSAHAVNLMRASGFENVWNVQGGILAWIARIDANVKA